MNKTYRLIWNSLAQAWQAVAETARAHGKGATVSAVVATSAIFCGTALAVPAVFFDGVTANGQSTFSTVVNTASPGATIFSYDFTSSASNTFSVTQGGSTVYVRTTRGGTANSFSSGLDGWSVDYNVNGGTAGWAEAVNEGFAVEFFSDASYTTPYLINAVGITVNNWGTCCTSGGVTPDGTVAAGSAIYAVFDASGSASATLIGNITDPADRATLDDNHFVAAIDDRNSFTSVTFVPNGDGEFFGAGGTLLFSIVPLNSVPAGSSSVTVGQPQVPNIDTSRSNFTTQELSSSQVNPVFDGGTLTLANSGTVTANFEVRATGGTIDTAGQDGEFTGAIADSSGASGAITKAGAGTLTLAGANTYTGTTTVTGGTLALTGSLASTDIRIGSGGTLLSTNGGLDAASTVLANGTFALGADEAIRSLSGSGAVALGSHTLGVTEGAFSGVVSGSGELHKTGTGTLTLAGTNTHTGTTRISGGTVSVGADANLGGAGASVELDGGMLQTTQSLASAKAFAVSANGGTLNTATGTTLLLGGALGGTGALVKQGLGQLVLSGPSTFTGTVDVSQGRLQVQADLATASGIVVRNGATLGGTGRVGGGVTVLNGGRLSPGASPGTLTVAGDVLLNSGSLFDVEIDGYGQGTGAGNYDRVVVTGNHTFTAAGTLTPIMRGITGAANNDFTAQVGDVFNIVQAADGSVTGRFNTLLQPTTGGLPLRTRFDVIYGATTIDLVVLPQLFSEAAVLGGGKRNAVNAGAGLDAIYDRTDINGTSSSAQLLRSLTGLTEQALAVRMASLSGEAHATALAEATRDSLGLRDAIFARQPATHCDADEPRQDKASLALPDDCRRVWAQVSRTEHDAPANDWTSATRAQSTLTSVGIERRVRPGLTGGLALGLAQGKVSSAFTSDRVETDSVQLSAYMTLDTAYGEFTQVAGVGLGRHDVQREIDAADNARNERGYNSVRVYADSRLQTPLAQWGNTRLSSVAGLRLDYLHRAAKNEAGDAASALELSRYNKLHGLAQIGALLKHTLAQTDKSRSELQLDMTYGYQLGGKPGVGTDVGLHGSTWGVRSAGDGPHQLTVGLSVGDQGPRSALSMRAYAGYAKGGNTDRGLQFTYSRQW